MNIFALHKDPAKAALYHHDKHVVKMILESAQMLCSAVHLYAKPNKYTYKLTHKNHPCTIWTCESLDNWLWLYTLTKYLNREYKYRFNTTVNHKSYIVAKRQLLPILNSSMPSIGLTSFRLAMPTIYKSKNSVKSYREFYTCEKLYWGKRKRKKSTWSKRGTPDWIKNETVKGTKAKHRKV